MEDVGRVRVKVAAREGLCSVFRCVAAVVEWIVGVLLLACSAWFVHAVTDGNSCRVGAGPGWRCGKWPLGFVVRVPRHRGVRIGAVEPWGHPCVCLWRQVGCGVGVVACYEVQYGPIRALGSQAPPGGPDTPTIARGPGLRDAGLPHPPKQPHTPATDPPTEHSSPPPTPSIPHTPAARSPTPQSTPTTPSDPHTAPCIHPQNPRPNPPSP